MSPAAKISSILVPVDFSSPSKAALVWAVELATKFSAPLTLIHVHQPPSSFIGVDGYALLSEADELRLTNELERALTKLAGEVASPGLATVGTRLLHGVPFVEIIRYGREQNFDLIVMGTRGRTGLKHILLGSVAEKVVRKAHCPVLTVRSTDQEFELP